MILQFVQIVQAPDELVVAKRRYFAQILGMFSNFVSQRLDCIGEQRVATAPDGSVLRGTIVRQLLPHLDCLIRAMLYCDNYLILFLQFDVFIRENIEYTFRT